ncbi:MAG: NAD(P)-dependent oxidoreductase [Hyphomicrobiales bacterium]|nr:MAG: NAD(P)-dependent oxidoreductase [Hyphomicrobiales bacterium]
MSGRVTGKVAVVTGAARGQGRSHAIRLAEEGADIVALDICGQVESVLFPMATAEDLRETHRLVEATGRRVVTVECDVRDDEAVEQALQQGVSELGRLDVVVANAGIASAGRIEHITPKAWRDMLDVNLTGVWNTCRAAVPHLTEAGGGTIILVSSVAGLRGMQNIGHYVAAKHGVVGLMRAMANELGERMIRVNTVHPGQVATPMLLNKHTLRLFRPDLPDPTVEDIEDIFIGMNTLPVPWLEPVDVSNAVLFLVSDEARYITGVTLPVDAGMSVR